MNLDGAKTLLDAITGGNGTVTRVCRGSSAPCRCPACSRYGEATATCEHGETITRGALSACMACDATWAAGDDDARDPVTRPADPGESEGRFARIGREIGELVAAKNRAYGDSFARSGEVMRVLYPDGIRPEQYDDALAVVRVVDKLFRVATDRDALGESPWRDIAGYGVLGAARARP